MYKVATAVSWVGGCKTGTGGGGLPSVGSCSYRPDTKEAHFRKKVRFGLTVINLNSKPNQKAFFFLAHSSQQ